MLLHPFPHAFGVDFGDLSLKVVQLRNLSLRHRRPTYELDTFRSISIPPGLIINGEIQEPEKVRKYLEHLLTGSSRGMKPIRSRWVVGSLPDTQGFLKLITIKKKQEEIIEEDILIVAKKHIPFDENEYYLDWQIMPEVNNKETRILLGAAPKRISDMYTYLLESLGLGVIALEIESLATARAMITADKSYQDEARAILDLGAARSTLIIYDKGHIQFTRSLPFSGNVFTTAISQKLKISMEDAEKKKIHDGLMYKRSKTWPILSHLAEDMADQIEKTIQFYYSHFPNANTVTHITMCGGGALMKNLDTYLSNKLHIDARPGHVWKNLFSHGHSRSPLPNDPEALHYATSIGLALRAADNPFFVTDII